MITIVVAQSRTDLRLSSREVTSTQQRYQARGQVAEAIASLNEESLAIEDLTARPAGHSRAWAVEDPSHSEVFHVSAQVGQESYTQVVVERPLNGYLPLVFLRDAAREYSALTATGTEPLPPVPHYHYEPGPRLVAGLPAGAVQSVFGSGDGRLYTVYQPAGSGPPFINVASRDATGAWFWEPPEPDRFLEDGQTYQSFVVNESGAKRLRADGQVENRTFGGGFSLSASPTGTQEIQKAFSAWEPTTDPEDLAKVGGVLAGDSVPPPGAPTVPFQGRTLDPASQTLVNRSVSVDKVLMGASKDSRRDYFGVAHLGPGDVRLVKNAESGPGWEEVARFGSARLVSGTVEIEAATVAKLEVDWTGEIWAEVQEGGKNFLVSPLAGKTRIPDGTTLAAASGAPIPPPPGATSFFDSRGFY